MIARFSLGHWVAILGSVILCTPATAQEGAPPGLRLVGAGPTGLRSSVTESWGTLRIEVANTATEGRNARVVVFYPERPDVQFSKDIFVPERSTVMSWMAIGPAPKQSLTIARDLEVLLYDRTGGQERLILPPGGERTRSRRVLYSSREPTTSVLVDETAFDPAGDALPNAAVDETIVMLRSMREASGLSEVVSIVQDRFLPPTAEAFDGIDVVVLASNRLAADPVGCQALRRWVQQGGTLWVQLDRVSPETVAPIFGDQFNVQVVDRVGLTTIRLHRAQDDPARADVRNVEQPIDLVRVVLGAGETALYTTNGWPASFVQTVGRGRVFFTTLGPRGWVRPRAARDPRSRFANHPTLPVATDHFAELALQLHPRTEQVRPPHESLRELLLQEVGYSVVSRGTATGVFAGFIVALLGLVIVLRRSRRPQLAGWLAPAAALIATVAFFVLGEASHQGLPPTIGVAEVVDAVPGHGDDVTSGVVVVYRPSAGPVPLGSDSGGMLELDDTGLEGGIRRRAVTDLGKWRWEGLQLPAGVRTGTFLATRHNPKLSAVARFDTNGVEGRLSTGSFRGGEDALILTPTREPLSVRLGPNDGFNSGDTDALPPGQYLTAAVLTDRQQRRQAVYRQLLDGKLPRHWEGRNLLFVWTEPSDIPFQMGDGVRTVGASLLALPLEFERPPVGQSIAVPRALVPYARILEGRPQRPVLDGASAVEMHLRFQLPHSVLPMTVERLRFHAKVRAPNRKFAVTGTGTAKAVGVTGVESPVDPILVEISDPRLLQVDADGGLHLTVTVSEQLGQQASTPVTGKGPPPGASGKDTKGPLATNPDQAWRIESLGLEVIGRTQADR